MPFLETPRFPEAISFGAEGGPGFATEVVAVQSGQEYRNQVRSLELGAWDVAHAARLPTAARALASFFRIAAGRANGFRFKDWTDYLVDASDTAIGVGVFTSLGSNQYQMWKRYTSGASTYDRKIQKPISGTVTIVGGTGPTVDYATGIVTSTTAPTSWHGQFDVPCRFDTDVMRAITRDKSGSDLIIGWDAIPIVEIRV